MIDGRFPLPRDTPQLRSFCRRISPNTTLQLVAIRPMPWAAVNQCFPNVERMVQEHGGQAEYGWQLWELFPGVLLEAELHAVWIDEHGSRLDITPKQLPVNTIAYLPDPAFAYEGRQVDNHRLVLTRDPLARALVSAYRERFKALNDGALADQYGNIDSPRIRAAHKRVAQVEQLVAARFFGA